MSFEIVDTDYEAKMISIGVEAAYAANVARDAMIEVEEDLTHLESVKSMNFEGASVSDDAVKVMKQKRNHHAARFVMFLDTAAGVLGPDVKGTDTLFNSFETEKSDQSDDHLNDVKELLRSAPTSYMNEVIDSHSETVRNIAKYKELGKLPEESTAPNMVELAERIVALVPSYEHMERKGWMPEVVFYQPKNFHQMDSLLTNQKFEGLTTDGAYRTWDPETADLTDPTREQPADQDWDVAIISTNAGPVFRNVSPDGAHGSKAKEALEALAQIPGVTADGATNPELVIKQASPSEDVYLAEQLSRFERGLKPLDIETWTIGKENITVGGSAGSLVFGFSPGDRRVYSDWRDRDDSYDRVGVRPSVRGIDLDLEPKA